MITRPKTLRIIKFCHRTNEFLALSSSLGSYQSAQPAFSSSEEELFYLVNVNNLRNIQIIQICHTMELNKKEQLHLKDPADKNIPK